MTLTRNAIGLNEKDWSHSSNKRDFDHYKI